MLELVLELWLAVVEAVLVVVTSKELAAAVVVVW